MGINLKYYTFIQNEKIRIYGVMATSNPQKDNYTKQRCKNDATNCPLLKLYIARELKDNTTKTKRERKKRS